jgi:hypothetical protein
MNYRPEESEEETVVQEVEAPVEQPKPRGRPKAVKAEDTQPMSPALRSKATGQGFVLMLGCKSRKQLAGTVYLEEVLASAGAEVAKQSNPKSYYEADVWRRRDALAAMAPTIAQALSGGVLVVPRLSTDTETLVEALCALASEVFEADGFRKEK